MTIQTMQLQQEVQTLRKKSPSKTRRSRLCCGLSFKWILVWICVIHMALQCEFVTESMMYKKLVHFLQTSGIESYSLLLLQNVKERLTNIGLMKYLQEVYDTCIAVSRSVLYFLSEKIDAIMGRQKNQGVLDQIKNWFT